MSRRRGMRERPQESHARPSTARAYHADLLIRPPNRRPVPRRRGNRQRSARLGLTLGRQDPRNEPSGGTNRDGWPREQPAFGADQHAARAKQGTTAYATLRARTSILAGYKPRVAQVPRVAAQVPIWRSAPFGNKAAAPSCVMPLLRIPLEIRFGPYTSSRTRQREFGQPQDAMLFGQEGPPAPRLRPEIVRSCRPASTTSPCRWGSRAPRPSPGAAGWQVDFELFGVSPR